MSKRVFYLLLGPALFFFCRFLLPSQFFGSVIGNITVGLVAWMALWWITAPVDLAVTAFLPIVVNAFFPMAKMNQVIANYSSETILLLLGASVLTVAWEETGLDKRIAARLLSLIGNNMRSQIVLWFLISGLMSTVLPNAVVCAAIFPIAVAMLRYAGEGNIAGSSKASLLLLTVVYAAGVGGLGTPLGGAMNLVTVQYIQQVSGNEFIYMDWVIRYLPIMVVLFGIGILFLVYSCPAGTVLGKSREYFIKEYQSMPAMTREEMLSLVLFLLAALLAFTRQFYQGILPGLKPAYAFMFCACLSFFIVREDGTRLMRWNAVQKKIIWGLIFVFAGGLAAGTLIKGSGAAQAIGEQVANAGLTGGFMTVFAIILLTTLLSNVTSNTATAAVSIPIIIAIIEGIGENPMPYIYVASIGVNQAYMFPTSVRAIPVGYGLSPAYMLKMGIPLTVMIVLCMSVMSYLMMQYWSVFSCN
ncbi:MAG: SLC13 family permease [Schwartzia succinivorans]|nr:SLC13 family permease [Schwartzia succinivorans]